MIVSRTQSGRSAVLVDVVLDVALCFLAGCCYGKVTSPAPSLLYALDGRRPSR